MKKPALTMLALLAALQFSYAQTFTTDVTINATVPSGHGSGYKALWFPNDAAVMPENGATYSGVYLSANMMRTSTGWGLANTAKPSWALMVANGSANEGFYVFRSSSGTFSPQVLFKINDSGNVGINTSTPQRRLDISNSGQLTFGDDVITNSNNGLYWHSGSNYGIYRTSGAWNAGAYQQLRVQFDTGIQLGAGTGDNSGYDKSYVEIVNGKGLMVSSGNVGINTTNTQGYKLAVNGSAIATSMKVKLFNNWPDFVFLKGYKLPTLTQVKTYIDKNQHLPDMPSADEVYNNGLDLGEMNRLLVKKVEELTLYLIQKDEQLKDQEKTNRLHQQQIDELKEQLTILVKNTSHK